MEADLVSSKEMTEQAESRNKGSDSPTKKKVRKVVQRKRGFRNGKRDSKYENVVEGVLQTMVRDFAQGCIGRMKRRPERLSLLCCGRREVGGAERQPR